MRLSLPYRRVRIAALWAVGAVVCGQSPAKRLILHDFGGPNRTDPAFVRRQLAYLETLPIDGLAILMSRTLGRENISATVLQPSPISLSRMTAVLEPMAGIRSAKLQANFGLVYFGPGYDVYNDAKWAISAQNMANLGQALKTAGLVGIFFDNENYDDYGDWRPGSPTCDARLHSLRECQAKMRERGGQIMLALQSTFPEIVVLFLHDAYTSDRAFFDQNPGLPNVDASNELVGPFLVGFVEAKGSNAAVIQGGENAGAHSFEEFDRLYQYSKHGIVSGSGSTSQSGSWAVRSDGTGFIPPALHSRWSTIVGVGTEIRNLDNVDADGNPRDLAATVANAMSRADQYAWLYMDVPPKSARHTSMLEPPGRSVQSATEAFVDAVRAGRDMALRRSAPAGRNAR